MNGCRYLYILYPYVILDSFNEINKEMKAGGVEYE